MKFINIFFCLNLSILNCFAYNKYISNYVFQWADIDKSVVENYLNKSANSSKKNIDAIYILGTLYLGGGIIQKDLWKARYYLTLAANLGSLEALSSLGDGFYSGDIFEKNINCALFFYAKAATLGFGPAQFNAGIILLKTAKSKKDLRNAVFYLDKASKNHDDLGDITKYALKYKKDAEKKLKSFK
ncbi:MAG: sel1 repeat family protein [Holosporales bacterium]|nr:sel1 repeat family protein [Holosporales bacterium]